MCNTYGTADHGSGYEIIIANRRLGRYLPQPNWIRPHIKLIHNMNPNRLPFFGIFGPLMGENRLIIDFYDFAVLSNSLTAN